MIMLRPLCLGGPVWTRTTDPILIRSSLISPVTRTCPGRTGFRVSMDDRVIPLPPEYPADTHLAQSNLEAVRNEMAEGPVDPPPSS
jgi:hypothetical protein